MRARPLSLLTAIGALAVLPRPGTGQQPVTVTGRVTSEAGTPLLLVDVRVPELALGALTRDDGVYTIVVPGARVSNQQVTIVARVLGYKSQSVRITLSGGIVTQDFRLASNPLQLGEVVVTGAGTAIETEKLGNVRNHVDSSAIQKAGEVNVVEALAAKAPNVTVVQESGDPGAGSFINIRGVNSILGPNQPLFVVDGMPMDNSTYSTSNFNRIDDAGGSTTQAGETEGTVASNRAIDLDPSHIESVEVLKGPAASAIYGARAGAGVVLITTKSGHAGPTHFTLHSSTSFDDINHTYPLQTTWGLGNAGVHADTSLGGVCDQFGGAAGACLRSWGPTLPVGTPVFDHANEIYRVGHSVDNGITVSGGNDRTTFYLSADNTYQNGVLVGPNDHLSRTSLHVKGSHQLLDNLRIGASISYADTRGAFAQRGNNTNGVQIADLRQPPEFDAFPYLVNTPVGPQERAYGFLHPNSLTLTDARVFDNPFWVLYEQENTSQVGRMFGNVNAEFVPLPWLKFAYSLGADYWTDERLEGCPVSSSSPCQAGRVVEGKIVNYAIDHNFTGTATYAINPNVGGTLTLGQNLDMRNVRQLGTVGRTFVALQPFKLSNTVTQDLPIDAEQVIHDAGWFGQGTLDLWNELHLAAALRNDGSSTFGQSNLRSWFPKGSAAWEFSKVIPRQSWLSYGKARIAYGEAGIEPQPYLTTQTYSSSVILGGVSQGTGMIPSQAGIPGLASNVEAATSLNPERSKEFETGVDLGFLKDRADASVTWYNKVTSDVILLAPVAPSSGYSFQAANAATIRNRGWELSLNARLVQRPEYGWDVGLQWARNRSLVEQLPAGLQYVVIGDFNRQVAMTGKPVGVYWGTGFMRCGVSANGDSVNLNVAGTSKGTLGQFCNSAPNGALFVGPDGMPVADPDLRVVQDPNYDWTGSVRTSLHYRKFRISGLFDIRHGGQIWNGTKGALWSYGTHLDTQQRATCTGTGLKTSLCTGNLKTFGQGGWWDGPVVGPGSGVAVPIGENWYKGIAACPYTGIDEPCIEDAGFVKVREISITYTIDAAWMHRVLGFSSMDLRLSGRNLKTWTKYTGYDPETSLGGPISSGLGAGGVDYFNNPQTQSFAFAITLNQ